MYKTSGNDRFLEFSKTENKSAGFYYSAVFAFACVGHFADPLSSLQVNTLAGKSLFLKLSLQEIDIKIEIDAIKIYFNFKNQDGIIEFQAWHFYHQQHSGNHWLPTEQFWDWLYLSLMPRSFWPIQSWIFSIWRLVFPIYDGYATQVCDAIQTISVSKF